MSPFSKVEMSPFVVLKLELQHERYGAGGAPTTNEPKRANTAGSYSTSQTKDPQTTPDGGVVVTLSAAGETAVQSVPGLTTSFGNQARGPVDHAGWAEGNTRSATTEQTAGHLLV